MKKKHKPLHPIDASEVIKILPEEPLPPSQADLGVTVAAFVLGSEDYANTLEIGPSNISSETIRKEILKAIQEEGESF